MTRSSGTRTRSTRRECLRQLGTLPLLALPLTSRQVPSHAVLLVLMENCEGRELAALPGWPRWTASGTLLSPVREIEGTSPCPALLAGSEARGRMLTEAVLEAGSQVALVTSGTVAVLDEMAPDPARTVRIGCAALQAPLPVAANREDVILAALRAAGVEVPAVRSALLQRRILRRGLLPVNVGEDAHQLTAASVALELTRELPAALTVLRLNAATGNARSVATMNRVITQAAEAASNELSVVVACFPTSPLTGKQEPQRAAALLFGRRFKPGFALRSGATLLDLAPLLAHLLAVKLPDAKGKLLRSVLA